MASPSNFQRVDVKHRVLCEGWINGQNICSNDKEVNVVGFAQEGVLRELLIGLSPEICLSLPLCGTYLHGFEFLTYQVLT